MRIESYFRDLNEEGYIVTGSSEIDCADHDASRCAPLKMSLVCHTGFANMEELIRLADSDAFLETDDDDSIWGEFRKSYADIMTGKCPDWQLGGFRVFPGGIILYYGNVKTGAIDNLWITGVQAFFMEITAPRTRLGFVPTYNVQVSQCRDGSYHTYVLEDLGYISRELTFHVKDPTKKTDLFHSGNTSICVTEYAGM